MVWPKVLLLMSLLDIVVVMITILGIDITVRVKAIVWVQWG